jgi:hypothetical protein
LRLGQGKAPVFGGSAASWLFKFTAKPHFLLGGLQGPRSAA